MRFVKLAGGLLVFATVAVVVPFVGGARADTIRPYLPLAGTAGMVLFGVGLHEVLWRRSACREPADPRRRPDGD